MLGAITGDIVGSVYEWNNIKYKKFEPLFSPRAFFTDDTILTVALMDAILNDRDYGDMLRRYYNEYPHAGYGNLFHQWCKYEDKEGYNSWGNGSAMRTSAVGYAFDSLEEVLEKAEYYASFTHNHPEGIKGAQATSACIFMARMGLSKDEIRANIANQFGYDLNRTINDIRPDYIFNESCQGTVPEAIIAFLDSTDYEDAIRCAVSLGGDSDTLTCITGGIAEAFYGDIPQEIADQSMHILVPDLSEVVVKFYNKYRPSDTITSAYKDAGKFVKELNQTDDHFQENQDKFWKSVVEGSKQTGLLNSLSSLIKKKKL